MKTLALETSHRPGSLALLDGPILQRQVSLPDDQKTAESFATVLSELLRSLHCQPDEIRLVAVTRGPGSFTGLRIGITAAKTLAYAVNADLVAVDTMTAIASQAAGHSELVVLIDAQREQFFHGLFDTTQRSVAQIGETRIISREQLAAMVADKHVSGPGIRRVLDDLPSSCQPVDQSLWLPQAETVGRFAYEEHTRGRRDDLWKLVPEYLRQSAAEEQLATRVQPAGHKASSQKKA